MIEIYSYKDGLKKLDIKNLKFPLSELIWVDINDVTKEEANLIGQVFGLHQLTTEDFINQKIRIKVEEFPHYLFCVFYGLKNESGIEHVELDVAIGKNFIITNHKSPLKSIESLKTDNKKSEVLFKKGGDYLFHKILDMEVDGYLPILEELDDAVEEIEEEAISRATSELMAKILEKKRLIVKLKRHAIAQRDKVSFLAKNECEFISKRALPYFRDIYDHTIRVSDTIDNQREAIGNCFDVYMSSISNNMNQVMKVLSIIATIALPLGVISGIYGTNFSVLPGAGIVGGFWLMIGSMAIVVFVMLFMFKRLRWF